MNWPGVTSPGMPRPYAPMRKRSSIAMLFVTSRPRSGPARSLPIPEGELSKAMPVLTNASGADSFPITSFTWIYLRLRSAGSARSAALSDLLEWVYTDGQQYAVQEGYSELPPPLLAALRKKIKELQ